jgi:hypothetical protein
MMLEKHRTLSEVIDNLRGELGAPSPHHGVDLKGFISRGGKESKQKIRQFYIRNRKIQQQEHKRYSSAAPRIVISKQDFGFLHIINGSGLGKTWMGQYVCKYVTKRLDRNSVMCHLDFANGNRYLFIASIAHSAAPVECLWKDTRE